MLEQDGKKMNVMEIISLSTKVGRNYLINSHVNTSWQVPLDVLEEDTGCAPR